MVCYVEKPFCTNDFSPWHSMICKSVSMSKTLKLFNVCYKQVCYNRAYHIMYIRGAQSRELIN